jgi:hypothetical protein
MVQRGSTSRRSPRSQPIDHLQNAPDQIARHGDLRHLEGHIAPVDDKLRADLYELFPQAGQRPFLNAVLPSGPFDQWRGGDTLSPFCV